MRGTGAVILAVILLTVSASADPLRPGYPAGVTAARRASSNSTLLLSTGAAILTAVGIVASNQSAPADTLVIEAAPQAPPNVSVSTSATGTN